MSDPELITTTVITTTLTTLGVQVRAPSAIPPIPLEKTCIEFKDVDRNPKNFREVVPDPTWGGRAQHLDNRDCAIGDILLSPRRELGRVIGSDCARVSIFKENGQILWIDPAKGWRIYWPKRKVRR